MLSEPRSPAAKAQALSRAALFEGMSPGDLERLSAFARTQAFKAGVVIFRKSDLNQALYVIERGRVKISTGSTEGREEVLNLLGAPADFGEVALLDGGERTADATAVEPATLLSLDRRDMIPFLESQPSLMLRMLAAMTARLRWVSDRNEDAVFLEFPARLAKRLLLLGEHFGFDTPKGRRLTVFLPLWVFVGFLGVCCVCVFCLLLVWLGRALIEIDRGVLILKDRPALGRIAGQEAQP